MKSYLILIINCGTSSIKMTLFGIEGEKLIDGKKTHLDGHSSYSAALETMVEQFRVKGMDPSSLRAIGHRVVHGGEKFTTTTLITPSVQHELDALSILAPLHNPPALSAIEAAQKLFPHIPQYAVFDTAFHAHLPPHAAYYPIPWQLAQKYKIRRYGFHGIAHAFSWKLYSERWGEGSRVITVHLGSGSSLTAIREGISIDTSMGFTPLDGVMMATRSGEIDPGIVAFLSSQEGLSSEEIIDLLNRQSGVLGVSQLSSDMEKIEKEAPHNPQAKLALDMFIYHVQKKMGAYLAVLGGVDAFIFSGGIGENSPLIRRRVIDSFSWHGVALDEDKNDSCKQVGAATLHSLHSNNSSAKILVVGSDENSLIFHKIKKQCR